MAGKNVWPEKSDGLIGKGGLGMGTQTNDRGKKEFNRLKTAVALEYEPGEQAPKVIASGMGHIADRIIERAEEARVPVHKDEKLAKSLSILDVGEYIPPELYGIVAEVLIYVDGMEKIQKKIDKR